MDSIIENEENIENNEDDKMRSLDYIVSNSEDPVFAMQYFQAKKSNLFLDEMAKNEVRRSSNIMKIKSKIQHDELLKKTISELNINQPKKMLAEPSSMKKLISGENQYKIIKNQIHKERQRMEKIHIEVDFYNKYKRLNNNFDMKKNGYFLPPINLKNSKISTNPINSKNSKNVSNLANQIQKPLMIDDEKNNDKETQKRIYQNKRGNNSITKDYSSQKIRKKVFSSNDFDPIYDTSDKSVSTRKSVGQNRYYKEMVTPQLKNPIYYIPLCANMAIRKHLNKIRNRIELEVVSKPADINIKFITKIDEENNKKFETPSVNKFSRIMNEEEKRNISVERFKEEIIKNNSNNNNLNFSQPPQVEESFIRIPNNININRSRKDKFALNNNLNISNSSRDSKPNESLKISSRIHKSQINLNQGNKL